MTFLALAGCGRDGQLPTECHVPEDQLASFLPQVPGKLPATLVLDSQFSFSESSDIRQMADVWNQYGKGRFGRAIFTVVQGSIAASEVPAMTVDESAQCGFSGQGNRIPVIRVSGGPEWGARGFDPSALGVTVRCNAGSRAVQRQAVFINAFAPQQSLFKSAVAHEFGHVLGLNHSCTDGGESKNYTSCTSIQGLSSHPYEIALMFPFFSERPATAQSLASGTNITGPKEQLRENDQRRICSLYYGG